MCKVSKVIFVHKFFHILRISVSKMIDWQLISPICVYVDVYMVMQHTASVFLFEDPNFDGSSLILDNQDGHEFEPEFEWVLYQFLKPYILV